MVISSTTMLMSSLLENIDQARNLLRKLKIVQIFILNPFEVFSWIFKIKKFPPRTSWPTTTSRSSSKPPSSTPWRLPGQKRCRLDGGYPPHPSILPKLSKVSRKIRFIWYNFVSFHRHLGTLMNKLTNNNRSILWLTNCLMGNSRFISTQASLLQIVS